MKNIVANISVLIDPSETDFSFELSKIARDRNICFYLVSEKGASTFFDGMGVNCYIATNNFNETQFDTQAFIEEIKASSNQEVETFITNKRFANEMLVYGTKIRQHLGSYYLIINSGIEPVDYGSYIIKEMYGILTLFVLIIATIASFLISSNHSKPIMKMTESAKRLATGDYNVNFGIEPIKYQEIADLGATLDFATAELSKMAELRKDLIANVSHDIKTPLTMIKAYAEMINDFSGQDEQKRQQHLAVIINEVNYLDQLVTDMLELSQLQSGSYELQLENVDLVLLTQEIINVFKGQIELAGIKLRLTGEKQAWVKLDRIKIGRVIYNFLSNALKNVGNDQLILISIKTVASGYQLSIIDHGSGIAEEELPFIWDRYYRINKNYQRANQGSGLGLAIAKSILETHGLQFGVNSVIDEGSEFYFIVEASTTDEA